MFTYCTQVLHLAEHAALNRIEAARAARRFPIILELLADGRIHLSAVRLVAPHLTERNHESLLSGTRSHPSAVVRHPAPAQWLLRCFVRAPATASAPHTILSLGTRSARRNASASRPPRLDEPVSNVRSHFASGLRGRLMLLRIGYLLCAAILIVAPGEKIADSQQSSTAMRFRSIVVSAPHTPSVSQVASPVRVTGLGYDGVIIVAEAESKSKRRGGSTSADEWTPTESIVREAEAWLRAYLDSRRAAAVLRDSRIRADLPNYKRQYWGLVRGGKREILIHFYHHDSSAVRGGLWLRGRVTVNGGWDQFFRITYRVEDKRFTHLQINAPE